MINDLKNKISSFTSDKICAVIITSKYLGNNSETIVLCMEELAQRRINGEVFDYESYIESEFKKLPQPTFNSFDIRSIISTFGKKK